MAKRGVLVAGGDRRQLYLANRMADSDAVWAIGFDEAQAYPALDKRVRLLRALCELPEKPELLVLPVPSSLDNEHVNQPLSDSAIRIEDLLDAAAKRAIVLAGKPCDTLLSLCARKGLRVADYFAREELAVLNAVPTAEGAIAIALREMKRTLFDSVCLVTGFGRIAKTLTRLLCAFGARVYVAARKPEDFAWIRIYGGLPIRTREMDAALLRADVVFNTVPAVLLDDRALRKLKSDALVIDLASRPGGVDFDAAKALSIQTVWALSLPGKTAPESAGDILKNTIDNMLSEMEEEE